MAFATGKPEGGGVSDVFKVGEVAIVISKDPYWNGSECTITGGLKIRSAFYFETGNPAPDELRYQVFVHGDGEYVLPPRQLRKKRPPTREQTTTWDKCIWRPRELVA